jgi:hypothetical protein
MERSAPTPPVERTASTPPEDRGLAREAIGLREVFFQSVTHMAPAGGEQLADGERLQAVAVPDDGSENVGHDVEQGSGDPATRT